MIMYLYHGCYEWLEIRTSRSGDDLWKCWSHPEGGDHSFDTGCKLWALGLSVGMHVLADKYDIGTLRQHACARLEELFADPNHEDDDIQAIRHAYRHSRPGDGIRELLSRVIVERNDNDNYDHTLRGAKNFYEIMKEMPDLSDVLLRHLFSLQDGAEKVLRQVVGHVHQWPRREEVRTKKGRLWLSAKTVHSLRHQQRSSFICRRS